MSIETRIIETLLQVQDERQRLDDAIHHHPIRFAIGTSAATTVSFIVSCLAASAPPLATVAFGVATGIAMLLGFLALYRVVGEQLFPDSLGADRVPAPTRERRARRAGVTRVLQSPHGRRAA